MIQTQPTTRHVGVDIKPPNYVILSVLVMIFGYWICGLIALIYALQVGRRFGSYEVGVEGKLSSPNQRFIELFELHLVLQTARDEAQ